MKAAYVVAISLLCGACAASAEDRKQVHWGIEVPGAVRADRTYAWLRSEPLTAIKVMVRNDEDSKEAVILEAGFFERLQIFLMDSGGRRVGGLERWESRMVGK